MSTLWGVWVGRSRRGGDGRLNGFVVSLKGDDGVKKVGVIGGDGRDELCRDSYDAVVTDGVLEPVREEK